MSVEQGNHVTDLLPEYVLDALADDEMAQVVEHLAACSTCQAEYESLQAVADDLPLALLQSAPPPQVKERLMRSVHSRKSPPEVAKQPSAWEKILRPLRPRLPAISLALIAVIALVNVLLWRQLNLANQQASTQLLVVNVTGTDYSPAAHGALVMDTHGTYGTLVVDNLASLDAGHQYQVWLINDGKRVSGGVFSVNPEGYASLEIQAPMPLIQYNSLGITIEPAGGSPGPTGAKVLGGNITQ
ncbi:MAG: anti-sigma factor domain-containing protein [Acidobacteriaceae bacterium]